MSNKVYEAVFASIKEKLEQDIIPWSRPWTGSPIGVAINAITGKPYTGSNSMLLWIKQLGGHTSPKYATYKQWQELDRQVKKGEKATSIVFWSKVEDEKTEKDFMFVRYYSVFNESQLEGYVLETPKEIDFKPIERAESIWRGSPLFAQKVNVLHESQRAFYSPTMDAINMPRPETFISSDAYYSVLFHEMGHATGQETRLKRDIKNVFGDHKYSKEELVAELCAAFLSNECALNYSIEAHADYCKSWLKKFNDHPKEMLQAFGQASKACDYILNRMAVQVELDQAS